ncbi:hypothetical protein QBC36DRAFT_66380 [Triangularia setosa]|uniref:N-acetylglucosamine-induced protein 1 n=1 Tax=Triangularia setosa TaxID=2587417 RepID=A0AAN6WHN7_9PEZI|nr:hypothetical protein QBC36DRAFT_66380 [Podospora setosa]
MGSTTDPPNTSSANGTGTNTSNNTSTPNDNDEDSQLPYWNVNLPPTLSTPTCPPFLLHLNEKDRRIIGTPDPLYIIESWPSVVSKINANRLDLFQRLPSDLRRYHEFCYNIKLNHGSVMNFILSERLGWELPLQPKGTKPFEEEEDVKVLPNDWPYGLDKRIVHLVVWVKFELEADREKGDLTSEARGVVDGWVRQKFVEEGGLEKGRVVWFRNWTSLKSVKSVEHFHVMLFDPRRELVDGLTGGDTPLCERVKLDI